MFEKYEDQGLLFITLMGENNSGQTPDLGELQEWAGLYGLNFPVVADVGFEVSFRFATGNTVSLPSYTLIAPGGEIVIAEGWVGESDILQHLPGDY